MATRKRAEPKKQGQRRRPGALGGIAKRSPTPVVKVAAKAGNAGPLPEPAAPKRPAPKARGKVDPIEVRKTFQILRERHADAHCELDHRSPFELIVATVLSAQSTDVMVNKVTPELFRRWPTAAALAVAPTEEVERVIGRTGFFRQKTKSIVGLSQKLVAEHGGEVPRTLAELVKLPGVGRKTANVVLGVAFGAPEGVVVDTHVQRISQRLGWTRHTEPVEIEQDLMKIFDQKDWDAVGHVLIFHGRRICGALRPACAACPVSTRCPSAFAAVKVGRKPVRLRTR